MKRRSVTAPAVDGTYGAIGVALRRVMVGDEARERAKGGAEVSVEGVALVAKVLAEVVHSSGMNREINKVSARLGV